jgi:hypothetical protein
MTLMTIMGHRRSIAVALDDPSRIDAEIWHADPTGRRTTHAGCSSGAPTSASTSCCSPPADAALHDPVTTGSRLNRG